jgi:diguanylate cyclase (GGDEF)-like protein
MLRASGAGQPAAVAGVLYAERTRTAPFSDDELRTMAIIAQLAGDALARALFADEMRRNAAVDGLTGLMTPSAFRERLREELAARRDVGLFFIDTDRFKLFNDTHGHAAGDRLLRRLAGIFSDCAALGHGFAGRNGGDEFCIALLDRTKDSCVAEAERIRTAVDGHELNDDEGGSAIRITVSIGVAHYPFDIARGEPRATEHLLEIADAQMYEAKRAGRNRVEFLRFPNVLQAFPHPGEGPIPRR